MVAIDEDAERGGIRRGARSVRRRRFALLNGRIDPIERSIARRAPRGRGRRGTTPSRSRGRPPTSSSSSRRSRRRGTPGRGRRRAWSRRRRRRRVASRAARSKKPWRRRPRARRDDDGRAGRSDAQTLRRRRRRRRRAPYALATTTTTRFLACTAPGASSVVDGSARIPRFGRADWHFLGLMTRRVVVSAARQ